MNLSRYVVSVIVVAVRAIQLPSATPQVDSSGFNVSYLAGLDDARLDTITITNTSTSSITAISTEQRCKIPGGDRSFSTGVEHWDVILYLPASPGRTPLPIRPHEQKIYHRTMNHGSCQFVASVIFADGHGEGPADGAVGWKMNIVRRQSTLQEIQAVKALLQDLPDDPMAFKKALTDGVRSRFSDPKRRSAHLGSTEIKTMDELDRWILEILDKPDNSFATKEKAFATLERWKSPIAEALAAVAKAGQ